MSQATLLWSLGTIIGILIFVLGLVAKSYSTSQEIKRKDLEDINKKLDELTSKVAGLEVKIAPFWASLQSKLADALTRPTHKEMDDLLKKLQNLTITGTERKRLTQLLHETVADESVDTNFRKVAEVLLVVEPLVFEEQRGQLTAGEPSSDLGAK